MRSYSIFKYDSIKKDMKCIYSSIEKIEDAELLAQFAIHNKEFDEVIVIIPSWKDISRADLYKIKKDMKCIYSSIEKIEDAELERYK